MAHDPAAFPNPPSRTPVRAMSLLSGGLDSQLAICVLRSQGIEVEAMVFQSPFFQIRAAQRAAAALNVKLHIVDFTRDILDLLHSPPHGFGSGLNPCIDCHARMLQRAGEALRKGGFDFVSTGEVLGQRPMSQHRQALGIVARDSGLKGFLLRPLSALRLEPTPMELDERVDRARLLGLEGRSRKPQLELARQYGLTEYPSPAGGCKLTEPNYSRRLKDLRKHEGLEEPTLLQLLSLGRHVRLPGGGRAIVGRNKSENETIRSAVGPGDALVRSVKVPGPSVLVWRGACEEDVRYSLGVCSAYADHGNAPSVLVCVQRRGQPPEEVAAVPLPRGSFTIL